jgi:hypothetical protein
MVKITIIEKEPKPIPKEFNKRIEHLEDKLDTFEGKIKDSWSNNTNSHPNKRK